MRPPGFAIGYHLRRMLAASDEQLRAAGLERGALEARLKNAEEKLRQAL